MRLHSDYTNGNLSSKVQTTLDFSLSDYHFIGGHLNNYTQNTKLSGLRLPHRNDAENNSKNLQPLDDLACNGLLAELQAKMSRGCGFLLFWRHSY